MTTPRFLDNDGLDGILPAEQDSSPAYLKWVGIVVILLVILLMVFFYSSSKTKVNSSLSTVELEQKKEVESIQTSESIPLSSKPKVDLTSALNNTQSIESKDTVSHLENDISVKDNLANTQPNELSSVPNQIEENIKANQANAVSSTEVKIDKLIVEVDSPDKQVAVENHTTTIVNPPSLTYTFEFSSKIIASNIVDEDSRLTDFVQQCDNKVNIVGHTCNLGPTAFNYQLGLDRAKAIQGYLVSKGVNSDTLIVSSKGMDQPIASNTTKSERKLNRRVELHCIKD